MMSNPAIRVKFKPNPLRLVLYAVFFTLMLFMLLPLSRVVYDKNKEKNIIRTVESVTQPPPPEVLKIHSEELGGANLVDQLDIQNKKSELNLEKMALDYSIDVNTTFPIEIGVGSYGNNGESGSGSTNGFGGGVELFDLNQLDVMPRSLNDPIVIFPLVLKQMGVREIQAEALVMLNEKGEVEFKDFVSISVGAGKSFTIKYVESLLYTPPTKNGEPVKSEFILPLRIAENN